MRHKCDHTNSNIWKYSGRHKDGIDTKQPDIYEKEDVEIISETRLDIQDIEEEVESQNTLEVRIRPTISWMLIS